MHLRTIMIAPIGKNRLKNFAVWARNKLIADITYKAGLIGVSEKGIAQPLPQSSKDLQFFDIGTKDYAQVAGSDIEQRNALVRAIQEKERFTDTIEKTEELTFGQLSCFSLLSPAGNPF